MFLWLVLALTGIKKERWTIFIRVHNTIMRTRNRIPEVDDTQNLKSNMIFPDSEQYIRSSHGLNNYIDDNAL
jgi:hypothetical protein